MFVRPFNDEHHGCCPSPWAIVIYSLAAMPHELIRLPIPLGILPHILVTLSRIGLVKN
jgi:hypothetical protein